LNTIRRVRTCNTVTSVTSCTFYSEAARSL
jgi:hypothetical protein